MNFTIRPLKQEELPLLQDFLYEAIFQRDGEELLPRSVIEQLELAVYIENFGSSPHDLCLCAEQCGSVVGAVWTRIIPGYGHMDGQTPEFALSLLPPFRGQGGGTVLMREMLALLKEKGYRQASLAVQKDNAPAVHLYRKLGFRTVGETEEEFLMVYSLVSASTEKEERHI